MTLNHPRAVLLDEMLSPRIAALLHEQGIECRAVAGDPVLCSIDDNAVLAAAPAESRILVTNSVVHFEHIRRQRQSEGKPVPHIIYTTDSTFPRDRQFVARLARALARAVHDDFPSRAAACLM